MKYQVAFNALTGVVRVQADGAAAGAGFTVLDKFDHPDTDSLGRAGVSHALYSHVQDVLYRKAGIQDMQRISVEWPGYVAPTAVVTDPTELTVEAGTSGVLEVTSTPADISDPRWTFSTSGDLDVFRINDRGEWSAYREGKAVVRVEHVSGSPYYITEVTVTPAGVRPATAVAVTPETATVAVNATTHIAN